MNNIEQVKDTVRKLLNLAKNDAAYEGEIENAVKFAQKLMAQHNLSEKDLIEKSVSREMAKAYAWGNGRKLVTWEINLGGFVRDLVGTVVAAIDKKVMPRRSELGTIQYNEDGEAVEGQSIMFFGVPEEVFMCKSLYENLALTIATMARMKHGTALRKEGKEYSDGFIYGLYDKLQKAKDTEKALVQQTNALVVRKLDMVKMEYNKKYGQGKPTNLQNRIKRTGAFDDGRVDGSKMDVTAERSKKIGTTRGFLN